MIYHDVNILDLLEFEADAFYVMDRGYIDWARLHRVNQAGAYFVTRAKSNLVQYEFTQRRLIKQPDFDAIKPFA